jgi:PKD repeat protein
VKLTVTNNLGCDSAISKPISFNQPSSKLGGNFTDCAGVSPVNLSFVNQSTTQPNSNYQIIWGTVLPPFIFNSTTFNTPITHSYSSGDTILKFIVTGTNGCIDTGIYRIFVGTNPGGSLTSPGNTRGCTGATFSFPFSGVQNNSKGTMYIIWVNDALPVKYDTFYHPPPLEYIHTFTKSNCAQGMPNSFTVSYLFTNPCAGIGTPGSTGGIQISDRPKPTFTISPKDTVCINSSVTFNSPVSNDVASNGSCSPTKVIWKISGNPGTDWTLNPGNLGNDFGTDDPSLWIGGSNSISVSFKTSKKFDITLKTGGRCGTGIVTDSLIKTICVDTIPTGSFTVSKDSGCAPLPINISTVTNTPFCGTYKYRWTVTYSNPMSCSPSGRNFRYINNTDSTTRQPSIEFINPGVYTLGLAVISPGGTCSSTIFTKQITVKGKPNVSFTAASVPSAICQNKCIVPRATYNCYINSNTVYLWSFPGGAPSSSTSQNPDTICYSTPGTYTISLKVSNECGDTTITRQITVNPAPNISSTGSTNPATCGTSTGSILLNGLLANTTYLVTYTRSAGPVTVSLRSDGNGTITIPGLPADTYRNIIVSLNNCSSNIIALITITDPNPPATPIARSNSPVCIGDTLRLFTDAVPGATYSWTGPGFSSPLQNPVRVNVSASMSGLYSVTIKLNGCSSAPGSVNVVIRPKPAKPVVCASTVFLLS